jgi:Cu(I)/Ag(I) efflux system membrane protein CusA/SilA
MTYEKLIHDMDEKLQFPGLTNTWTMPVENRLDMELTGIKTAVGIKIQGPDLAHIEDIGARMQQIFSACRRPIQFLRSAWRRDSI